MVITSQDRSKAKTISRHGAQSINYTKADGVISAFVGLLLCGLRSCTAQLNCVTPTARTNTPFCDKKTVYFVFLYSRQKLIFIQYINALIRINNFTMVTLKNALLVVGSKSCHWFLCLGRITTPSRNTEASVNVAMVVFQQARLCFYFYFVFWTPHVLLFQ